MLDTTMPTPSTPAASYPVPVAASFPRRLIAMVYDFFLLLAVLMLAAYPAVILLHGGEAFTPGEDWLAENLFRLYLVTVAYLFFAWFWTHGGQTLGMRAWRLRVTDLEGKPIGWDRALLRYVAAILSWAALGLGFLWILVDPQKRAWHDILSRTRIIVARKFSYNIR